MGGIALLARELGHQVSGSDANVYPPMSTLLACNGITLMEGYDPEHLRGALDVVVVGNAMSRGNPAVEHVLNRGMRYASGPQWLAENLLQDRWVMAVAGTHGKTTTTSMLAWMLEHAGLKPGFLIGGVAENFGTSARVGDAPFFVVEADEYDTAFFDKRSKFIHYLPEVAIVNNLEFDHADIFENLAAVQKTFSHFIRLVPRNGLLLGNGDDPNLAPLLNVNFCPVKRFGLGEHNAIRATNLRLGPTASEFEIPSAKFHLNLVGELNVRNALAVVAAAKHCGLTNKEIQSAFDTFKGIKRRMEVRGISGGVTVIDDFGHHPTAIRETLRALRVKYAKEKIWAIFEPRSNTTRRNVFQQELAEAFADADGVIVSQIARLELLRPEERLNPGQLMATLQAAGKNAAYLADADAIVAHCGTQVQPGDVVCVFSNGGFGDIHQKLLARFERR